MNLRHDGGAFPYRRGDTFGRTSPHVANGENAGPACLKRQNRAGVLFGARSAVAPGDYEPLVVQRNAAIEPRGVRVCADE